MQRRVPGTSTPATPVSSQVTQRRLDALGIAQPRFASPEAVATHLGAMQAQDYPGALWSMALRTPAATRQDVERAIAERRIIRTWPMRGTLHFVPAADARWMLELLAPRIMKGADGRHRQLELDDATFAHSRRLIAKALTREPVLTRSALFSVLDAGGIAPTGQRGIHILQRLSLERMLCFGPHAEKQPTFVLFDDWIQQSTQLDRDDALRTLAERFFGSHGPATIRDFIWWTGLRVSEAKVALHLAQPSLERMEVDGAEHWMARDRIAASGVARRAHLLPGFDEYLLGYKDRSAALAARHANRVVPGGNGVFMSTLVLDGKVIGTWRRSTRPKGVEIEAIPFARLKADDRKAFTPAVERYAAFLGVPVRLTWPTG